jgi:hypothetical protein
MAIIAVLLVPETLKIKLKQALYTVMRKMLQRAER